MDKLDKIEPVDSYVLSLLAYAKKKYNLKIDLDKLTRAQRLEAAVSIKDEANGHLSMEIMVGRRISSEDPLNVMLVIQGMFPQDPRIFYDGFSHDYNPNKE